MYLILSPKNEGYANLDKWTAKLDKAVRFDSKEEALSYVREEIARDQEEKIFPRFTGCRVVELRKTALARLRKLGFKVSNDFALDVGKYAPKKARETWPREIYGFKTSLVRDGVTLSWESPRPWNKPGPNPKRLKK